MIIRESGRIAAAKRVTAALAALERPAPADLRAGIEQSFASEPKQEWRDHIKGVARQKVDG
jgi:hypothetical protein